MAERDIVTQDSHGADVMHDGTSTHLPSATPHRVALVWARRIHFPCAPTMVLGAPIPC